MSTSVQLVQSGREWTSPAVRPFDEVAWRVWAAKGRSHDRRLNAAWGRLVRWIPIAALLAAAVFGALVLLYNPVVPGFGFSGGAQRVLVTASAIPFAASLAWRQSRRNPHG